jgi:hypothetical protein
MLWAKWSRSRAKRSSGIEGEAVEAMTCSRGEAVKGALHRRRHALGVGGVEVCSVSGQGVLHKRWRQRPKASEWRKFAKCGAGRCYHHNLAKPEGGP